MRKNLVKAPKQIAALVVPYPCSFKRQSKWLHGAGWITCLRSRCSAGLCNRTLGCAKRRASARQLAISPLATTTVGWVPDRTPAGPKRSGGLGAKRRVVRAGCRLMIELKGNRSRNRNKGKQRARCALSTCLQPLRTVSVISRGRSRVRLASNIEFVDKFKNETRNYMPEHVVNGKRR